MRLLPDFHALHWLLLLLVASCTLKLLQGMGPEQMHSQFVTLAGQELATRSTLSIHCTKEYCKRHTSPLGLAKLRGCRTLTDGHFEKWTNALGTCHHSQCMKSCSTERALFITTLQFFYSHALSIQDSHLAMEHPHIAAKVSILLSPTAGTRNQWLTILGMNPYVVEGVRCEIGDCKADGNC